jgi:hypothetical protein
MLAKAALVSSRAIPWIDMPEEVTLVCAFTFKVVINTNAIKKVKYSLFIIFIDF